MRSNMMGSLRATLVWLLAQDSRDRVGASRATCDEQRFGADELHRRSIDGPENVMVCTIARRRQWLAATRRNGMRRARELLTEIGGRLRDARLTRHINAV
jgi:hypothetical protein